MSVLVTASLADGTRLEQRFETREAAVAAARDLARSVTEDDQHGVLVLTPNCSSVTVEVEAL